MTLNDLFDGKKTFSYLGYTFSPYQHRINGDFFSISKRLYGTLLERARDGYDYDEFYKMAGCDYDAFICLNTCCIYIPATNYLFKYMDYDLLCK